MPPSRAVPTFGLPDASRGARRQMLQLTRLGGSCRVPRYERHHAGRGRVSAISLRASMMISMRTNRGRLLRSDDEIDELLARTRSVAVVGVSADSSRPSRRVAAYLIGATDWNVYLVNPNLDTALGRDVYPSLADL